MGDKCHGGSQQGAQKRVCVCVCLVLLFNVLKLNVDVSGGTERRQMAH